MTLRYCRLLMAAPYVWQSSMLRQRQGGGDQKHLIKLVLRSAVPPSGLAVMWRLDSNGPHSGTVIALLRCQLSFLRPKTVHNPSHRSSGKVLFMFRVSSYNIRNATAAAAAAAIEQQQNSSSNRGAAAKQQPIATTPQQATA